MYLPTSDEKKIDITTKTTSSVEYHTSIIQSIEIVKRPLLFNQHDNDTFSRFFSSSTVTKTSVFEAINENQNTIPNNEKLSPNNNKRFKRLNTDDESDSLPQLAVQSSIDEFITPTKQNRFVLKKKSPNIENQSSPTDTKPIEQDIDKIQV